MKRALLAFFLLTITATFGAYIVSRRTPASEDTSIARFAPQETVLYLEAPDLLGASSRIAGSPAASDFQTSRTRAELLEVWHQLAADAEKGEGPLARITSLGLPLDEKTAMRFCGQGLGVGLAAHAEEPSAAFVLTRVDVSGLLEDLASGGKSWMDVWTELRRRSGPEVKVEPYEGYEIVTREVGPQDMRRTVFHTQVDDLAFAATQRWAVVAFLDVQLGRSQGLSRHPGYHALESLHHEDLVARAWCDFRFWRDGLRVKKLALDVARELEPKNEEELARLEKELSGAELDVLRDDTHDLPGLAGGLYFAGGSPYALDVEGSHTAAEVFKDVSTRSPSAIAGSAPTVYIELPRIGRLIGDALSSEGWHTISQTAAYEWLEAKLDDPQELTSRTGERDLEEALTHDPRFEARLALAGADWLLPELAGERFVASAVVSEDPKDPVPLDFVLVNTLRPLPRLFFDVGLGVARAHAPKGELKVTQVAGASLYEVQDGGPERTLAFARVGADLVLARRSAVIATILNRPAGPTGSQLERLREHLAPDARGALLYYDTRAMLEVMRRFDRINSQRMHEEQARYYREQIAQMKAEAKRADEQMRGFYLEQAKELEQILASLEGAPADATPPLLQDLGGAVLIGARVSDDYTRLRVETVQTVEGKMAEYTHAFSPQSLRVEDEQLVRLPSETFLGGAFRHDPLAAYEALEHMLPEGAREEFEQEFKRELQTELTPRDLITHLGDWSLVGVVHQGLQPGAKESRDTKPFAVPAFVAAIGTRGSELERLLVPMIERASEQMFESGGASNEAQAIGMLRAISTAQTLFREADKDGDGRLQYSSSLQQLAKLDLIWVQPDMGYDFKVQASPAEPEFRWMAVASPSAGPGRHFAINQDGVVYHAWKPFALNDACELPSDALHVGAELSPPPSPQAAPKKPSALAREALAGVSIYRFRLPKRMERDLAPIGEGFSPCFAFADGALVFATSKAALRDSLTQTRGGLANSARFKRLTSGLSRRGSSLGYLSLAGIIDQVLENAEQIVRESAPLPPDMKRPPYPDYVEPPEGADREAFHAEQQKKEEAWEKEYQAFDEKVARWREERAPQNAKRLRRLLGSLRVLGGGGTTAYSDPRGFMKSELILQLDPNAR